MRAFAGAILVAVSSTVAASAQTSSPSVDVSIDTNAPGAVIIRNIYGRCAEYLGTRIFGGDSTYNSIAVPKYALPFFEQTLSFDQSSHS